MMRRYLIGVLACFWISTLGAWPVNPLGPGKYPVASTHLQATRPSVATMGHFLSGFFHNGQPEYITSVLDYPHAALTIHLMIPNDIILYGAQAGQMIEVVMYMIYPTSPENDRADYRFPYDAVPDTVLPRMQGPGDLPIPFHPERRFPLVIQSHGHRANAFHELQNMRFLASHGYIAVAIFHGDGRIAEYQSEYFMRPLVIKTAVNYLLAHPSYSDMIDAERIGVSGTSFGGFASLAVLGAKYQNHLSSVSDDRIKAGFATVPWLGRGSDVPFPDDYASLSNITAPFLAIVGEHDSIAPPERILEALTHTNGPSFAFRFNGEGHSLSRLAIEEARTLQVLFFDAYLKDSAIARQTLHGPVYVYGGIEDHKVLQRFPEPPVAQPNP